jgi:hypothetical protein
MPQWHKFIRSSIIWIVAGMVLLACTELSLRPEPPLTDVNFSPIWYGIAPGQTLLSEAISILGEPDNSKNREGYDVYYYREMKDFGGWEYIDLWVEKRAGNDTVVGIYRHLPYENEDHHSVADVQTLAQLATMYGRPDEVKWGRSCGVRFVLWTRQGVGAQVSSKTAFLYPNEYPVESVLFIEPMNLSQFLWKTWPWSETGPAPSSQKVCISRRDTLPQDPYNWDRLLELSK